MSDTTQATGGGMLPPSVLAKRALRRALRAHPQGLTGKIVSDMPVDELRDKLVALGVDCDQAIAEYAASMGQPVPADQGSADPADQGSADPAIPDPVDVELSELRGVIARDGFVALDQRLRALIVEARKPPVEIVRTIQVQVPIPAIGATGVATLAPVTMPTVPQSTQTSVEVSWSRLFGVKGKLGSNVTRLWDGAHPDTPKSEGRYVFPAAETAIALTQIARGKNVYLYGPPGTGKTQWASEVAARTKRPFALISCDNATDGPTLVGMTVPQAGGGTAWQDGQLTRAIQTTGCVVCIDEPSVARPGALFVMQNVLANRVLYISETGRRVDVAKGVIFVATDNTNGTGGGGRQGFTDTNRLNLAFLDRFGARVNFDFMGADQEARVLMSYTKCTRALADLLVSAATVTRAAAGNQQITSGISLRRLFAWAEMLTDGIGAEDAFRVAVLNAAPEQDRETLRQQCLLAYDKSGVAKALADDGTGTASANPDDENDLDDMSDVIPDPAMSNPTAAGRNAAQQFSNV